MKKGIKTVKNRVILMMVSFSVVISAMITVFALYLTLSYQRHITVQSVEFNLQLVANLIEQDLRDLILLSGKCGGGITNSSVADYFLTNGANEKMLSILAYNYLNQEVQNNRAGLYVRRLLAANEDLGKILQVDSYASSSRPITLYNVDQIEGISGGVISEWESISADPFYSASASSVIPLIYPVYHPVNRSRIGTIYLAATTSLITDKLKNYNLPENSSLFINFGNQTYCIEGDRIFHVPFEYETVSHDMVSAISPETQVSVARDPSGVSYVLITYPIRSGISLTQVSSQTNHYPQIGLWIWLLLGLVLLIVLIALLVTYHLDHTVSRPIARLRQKIDAIAKGDFSSDPSLEFDNELGLVGQGVNRLSHDVSVLMETRIRDEQQKRDLEYRMLQNQITPHFLHNTLNSIKWMATLQNADGIAEMVTALARLMKTIAKDIRKIVTLGDELALLNDYLVIQKYRYGNNVIVTTDILDSSLLQTPIPRFSLQPLVENAIFHGIEPKGAGNIFLEAARDGGDVLVTITDDGVGMSDELLRVIFVEDTALPGMFSKLGLRNVDERLRYAFGNGYGLSIKSEQGKYTAMTLRLPSRVEEEKQNGQIIDS